MTRARGFSQAGAIAALLAAAALAAGSAAAAPGGAGAAKPGRAAVQAKLLRASGSGTGIVQAVRARRVVVRALDGSIVRVPVGPRTRVFVNGVRAALADVKPGFVAVFDGPALGAARVLRAVDPSPRLAAGFATVQSVSEGAVVVTGADGITLTIPVDASTSVFLNGRPATLADVSAGDLVVVRGGAPIPKRPVRELRIRRPH